MKAVLIVGILACMGLLSGCHTSPEVASEVNTQVPTEPVAPPSEQPSESELVKSLPPATEWRTLYRDKKKEKIQAYFERAMALLEQQKGVKGELDTWSKYFGPWVVLEIKPEPVSNDLIAMDTPTPKKRAYLVDMASSKVVEMGDWRAAKPFFDAQMEVIQKGFSSSDDEKTFWANLASSASVVGFGHTNYVDYAGDGVQYPKPVSGPKWKRGMGKTELTYYVNESAMAMAYTRCVLTITDTSIVFNSEMVQPE